MIILLKMVFFTENKKNVSVLLEKSTESKSLPGIPAPRRCTKTQQQWETNLAYN